MSGAVAATLFERHGLAPLDELPSLRARTEAFYQDYLSKATPEIIRLKAESTRQLLASGIGERCVSLGGLMPAFTLPSANGREVASAALLASGPLVVSFYRGSWCGYCNLELEALQHAMPYLRALGANVVAICPELPDGARETADLLGLDFDILVDRGNAVAEAFGLAYPFDTALRPLYCERFGVDIPRANGDDSYLLPVTATYLVGQDGRVILADTNPDHTRRLEPRALIDALLAAAKE
jgi:peroxiredoxin